MGIFNEPKIPADRNPFLDLLRYFRDWCKSERVIQIKGFKEKQTLQGRVFFPNSAVLPPVSIQQFKIQSDGGDYWNCYTWDGTSLGSTNIKVAKPYKLRADTGKISSETIRGVTYTYTYTGAYISGSSGPYKYYTRSVSGSDGSSETDYMIPDPQTNDIIYGISFSTIAPSTLSAVTWLDINVDGRAWAS